MDLPLVTLLTDFGTVDGYVGAMKGVLLKNFPDLGIVDISHEIEPFNINQAAFSLLNYACYYPRGTIHIVVVDPGVGTDRNGIVIKTPDYYFIGPDNGVFSYICLLKNFQAIRIRESIFGSEISATFHGRDVFAPTAVKLLENCDLNEIGDPLETLVSVCQPIKKISDNKFILKIIHKDHFGNLILNFSIKDYQRIGGEKSIDLSFRNRNIAGIEKTFGNVPKGQILALWDSSGYLQISQSLGDASSALELEVGDQVTLSLID